MDNRGKGKPTDDRRVERNYSRPTESKPSRSDDVGKIVDKTRSDLGKTLKP